LNTAGQLIAREEPNAPSPLGESAPSPNFSMDDIKFHCPECKQRIGAPPSAVGMKIDCPRCFSTIVIPKTVEESVHVEVRRRLAILPGTQDDAYQTIEAQLKKIREASVEIRKAQAETQRLQFDIGKLREDIASGHKEKESLLARLQAAETAREVASDAHVQLAELRREVNLLKLTRDNFEARATQAEDSYNRGRDRMVAAERERSEMRAEILFLRGQLESSEHLAIQNRESQSEVDRLQTEVVAITSERDSLRISAGRAMAEMESMRMEVEKMNVAVAAIPAGMDRDGTSRIGELEAAPAEARGWGADSNREIGELQRQVETLRLERDAIRGELQVVQATRDEIRQRLSEREAALVKTSLTAEAARHEMERARQTSLAGAQERERLEETVEKLEKESSERQQRLDGLLERLHASEQKLEGAAGALAGAHLERDAVIGERDTAKTELAIVQAEAAKLRSTFEEIQTKGDGSRREAERLKESLDVATAAHAKIRLDLAAAQQQAASLEGAVKTRDSEMIALREQIAKEREAEREANLKGAQAVASLHVELEEVREKLTYSEDASQTYKTLIDEADRALNEGQAQLQEITAERDRLVAALGHMAGGRAGFSPEFQELKTSRDQLKADVDRLEKKIAHDSQYILAVEVERDQLRAELDGIKPPLERPRDSVTTMQSRRDQLKSQMNGSVVGASRK